MHPEKGRCWNVVPSWISAKINPSFLATSGGVPTMQTSALNKLKAFSPSNPGMNAVEDASICKLLHHPRTIQWHADASGCCAEKKARRGTVDASVF